MKKLLCVVVCLLVFAGVSNAQTRLEMRLAETEPGAGLTEAAVAASGHTIYLHESSVITNADVIEAHVVPPNEMNDHPSVAIRVTPDAAARLENATRAHIGKPIAVVVNGTVVSAPILRGVLRENAAIFGTFTQAEADEIAAGLMGR
jgi:preprotein translocase subunit SecD